MKTQTQLQRASGLASFAAVLLATMSPALAEDGAAGSSEDQEEAGTDAKKALDDKEYLERRNALASQPAVRQRKLLVRKRFELAPQFEATINAEYRHIVGIGLKAEYHLSDMLSVGGIGVLAPVKINTKLLDRILPTLEDSDPRSPTAQQLEAHLNHMPFHGAAYASFTPWYGKLAAFGKAFLNFDFYFQGGVAFATLQSDCPATICNDTHPGVPGPGGEAPDDDPNDDPPLNNGFRAGLYLGGGIHVFLNDFIALDLSIRDYAFVDNPSGADYNANLAVQDDDSRFLHHMFFGLGVSFMLPTAVKRTP